MRRSALACTGVVVLTLLWGCRGRVAGRSVGANASKPAGKLSVLPATSGDVLSAVKQAHGQVVLVNLWATWCQPCKEEFPDLLRLSRELGRRGFKLILVSADFPDLRPQVERFLADQGVDFPTFLKAETDDKFINGIEPRWTGALPATILFDASGVRRQFWEGKTTYDALLARVAPLLHGAVRERIGGSREESHPSRG